MSRRILVLIAATTLVLALLPGGLAAASAASEARLVAGEDILPAPSTGQEFRFEVTNNEASLLGLTGNRINFVRFILPNGQGISVDALRDITAPQGWEAILSGPPSSPRVLFVGGEITPGGTATFGFNARVARPADRDEHATFRVEVSSNDGETISSADPAGEGALTSLIRILEVLSVAPTAPAGVTDGSGTAGQATTWTVGVRNHAASAVDVTSRLTAEEQSHETGPASVGGNGGTRSFSVPVTLPSTDADRDVVFRATADAPGAESREETFVFRLLRGVELDLLRGTFEPRFVSSDEDDPGRATGQTFRIEADKLNTPGLTLDSGELRFASTTAKLVAPVTFGGGDDSTTLEFEADAVFGADGVYDATFELAGQDTNGAAFAFEETLFDLIEIDSIAPLVDNLRSILPDDEDGRRQTAAKVGDRVGIRGDIDDPHATVVAVRLIATDRDSTDREVHDVELDDLERTDEGFRVTTTIPGSFGFEVADYAVFAAARDRAANLGEGASVEPVLIDNFVPLLDRGETVRGPDDRINRITVRFRERPGESLVIGGCSPNQWRVEEQLLVTDVRYSNGERCESGDPGPDNARILVLGQTFDRDATPHVTYTPGGDPLAGNEIGLGDRLKDGAGNYAVQRTIRPIDGIVPPLPELVDVRRSNGEERATFDEDRYWTRFGGDDLQVTVAGGREGYRVRVTSCTGEAVQPNQTIDGSPATVSVAIGQSDGDHCRRLAFIDINGNLGPAEEITVALDTPTPQITGWARDGETVTVDFSEKIAEGRNFARDWFVFEGSLANRSYIVVNSVSGEDAVRDLHTEPEDPNANAFVEYLFDGDGDDGRYRDRAGNLLLDLIQ